MKITKKTALITAGTLALIIGVGAIADRGDRWGKGHDNDRHGWFHNEDGDRHLKMVRFLNRHLDLSDEQETQIAEIIDDKFLEMQEMRNQKVQEASDLLRADNLSVTDVDNMLDSIWNKRHEMQTGFSEVVVDIHAVLTPEQREQVADMILEGRGYIWHRNRNKDRS